MNYQKESLEIMLISAIAFTFSLVITLFSWL
jgi:hypothetical protein